MRSRMGHDLNALRDARIDLRDALENPGSFLGLSRVRIYDVLRRAPHLGNTGAKKILLTAKVWPLTRLGELEVIERYEILRCLPPRAR
jgi:hypothetical protein